MIKKCLICGKESELINKDVQLCRYHYQQFRASKYNLAAFIKEYKKKLKVRRCPTCGRRFTPTKAQQVYCSVECYRNFYKKKISWIQKIVIYLKKFGHNRD